MSDYLWDKTGEADAQVERLEGLLGELRYKPLLLELPTEVGANATQATRPLRTHRLFRSAGFAVAAALLLLAFVALALVLLRTNATGGGRQSATQTPQESHRGDQPPGGSAPQPVAPHRESVTVAREPE